MNVDTTSLRLRRLPILCRLGLSLLLLTVLGGLVASATFLVTHHQNRDERPGLSLDDIQGVYHGVSAKSPLVAALQRGHPDTTPQADRDALLAWLGGEKISENYDSLDLGEAAPAEIIDRNCMACHARQAAQGDGIGQRFPLEYWDDVQKIAFSRQVEPMDEEILVASLHTHAMGMGSISLILCLLALLTRWRPLLISLMVFACGLGLSVDLGCWILARSTVALVPLIVVGGVVWMTSTALLMVLILLDLWLPGAQD